MAIAAPPIPRIVTRGDLAGNVESFARHLRAANLTPATQRTYLASLDRLARFLEAHGVPTDVAAIRRDHLEAFLEDQLARPMARMRKPRRRRLGGAARRPRDQSGPSQGGQGTQGADMASTSTEIVESITAASIGQRVVRVGDRATTSWYGRTRTGSSTRG